VEARAGGLLKVASDNDRVDDGRSGARGATQGAGAREYRLAPALRVRLWGAALVAAGALIAALALAVLVADLPRALVTFPLLIGAVGLIVLGVALAGRWYVVRLDEVGYRVRFVRGVGRTQARWADVEDLTTAVLGGARCVVLRLRDGSTSTVPVNLIAGDREEFVDELQRRLDAGHGYRRL
jgi:hypothetical protein